MGGCDVELFHPAAAGVLECLGTPNWRGIMSEAMTAPSRPGVVTFVGVILYFKAAVALVIGIALLVEKDSLQAATVQDGDFFVTTAVGEFIVAALLFLVAYMLMSGHQWARLAVAIVLTFRASMASYWLISHSTPGIQWNALLSVAIAVLLLGGLYWNEKSQEYFERTGAL